MPNAVSIVGGTGALGFGLALRLGRAGCPVVIGSRDADRAHQAAQRAQRQLGEAAVSDAAVTGEENPQAAAAAEIVILTVPFASQADTIKGLQGGLRPGQLLIDATVPLATAVGGRPTQTLGVWAGSAAQQAAALAPDGVSVASAFHSVSASLLSDLDHRLDEDVLLCADRRADRERVSDLVERIEGLRAVDCGRLEMARILEQMTPLIISINVRHKVRAGIRITGLS